MLKLAAQRGVLPIALWCNGIARCAVGRELSVGPYVSVRQPFDYSGILYECHDIFKCRCARSSFRGNDTAAAFLVGLATQRIPTTNPVLALSKSHGTQNFPNPRCFGASRVVSKS